MHTFSFTSTSHDHQEIGNKEVLAWVTSPHLFVGLNLPRVSKNDNLEKDLLSRCHGYYWFLRMKSDKLSPSDANREHKQTDDDGTSSPSVSGDVYVFSIVSKRTMQCPNVLKAWWLPQTDWSIDICLITRMMPHLVIKRTTQSKGMHNKKHKTSLGGVSFSFDRSEASVAVSGLLESLQLMICFRFSCRQHCL